MLAETFVELIKDPNHWGFEIVAGLAEFLFVGILVRFWVRYHDRVHHGKD